MKNVLILGASGGLAKYVIDELQKQDDIHLTLFLRDKNRLNNKLGKNCDIIEGDVLDGRKLTEAMVGKDIVYVNLAGDLWAMAEKIEKAMIETGVKRVIAISSIGIYDTPLKSVLVSYRKLADVFENSNLDYTILRPAWFTSTNEVDFEITRKGEPERGSVISMKSLATFITSIIHLPQNYIRESLGINKPNS
ncbi:MAG: NAD(P)H-binding protein [Bacteroidota bacterium]|nr:NAD(P)H-binding protein [Bacteroidota bacterium]